MVDVRNVRGGHGLDGISDELNAMLDSVFHATRRVAEDFFAEYEDNPDPRLLAAWLEPRAWREIDCLFLLNEVIRRYGLEFQRKHIAMLARKSFQHAEHYALVGKTIVSLGGTVPTSIPDELLPWHEFLWECLERHPLAAIAALNCSETSASGSFDPLFQIGERYGFDEVVDIYQRIETDEKFFHVGLGRQLLATYAQTDDDRAEILSAVRGMHDIAWQTFTPASVVALAKRNAKP